MGPYCIVVKHANAKLKDHSHQVLCGNKLEEGTLYIIRDPVMIDNL